MVQPKTLLFTLVIPGVGKYPLGNSPSGWNEDTIIDWERNGKYYGLVRGLSVPLKFTLAGANLLRQQFYQYNAQALVYMQVEKLDPETWQYQITEYVKLDFSKAVDDENYFTVTAIEADISAKIKAFEGVKYEIPLDVPEAIDIELTPVKLDEKADLLFEPSPNDQQPGFTALSIINNEVKASQASVKDVPYATNTTPNFATDGAWFFQANTTTNLAINITGLKGGVITFGGGTRRFELQIIKDNGTVLADVFDITVVGLPLAPNSAPFNVTTSYNFTINAGEKIFIYQRITGTLNSSTGFNFDEGTISLSYKTSSQSTTCKALKPKDVLQALANQMNGNVYQEVQSFLLDDNWQLAITSGDAIRRIDNPKLKISFNDFFKSIDAVLCAGVGVENGKLTLESRASYYRNNKVLELTDATEVSIEPAADLMFNKIKVGYPDQKYDELNGRFEFNSEQNYVIDVTQPEATYDIMSVIRADAYGIEFLRINLDGKSTTDSDSDNDAFFVYIGPDKVGDYYRPLLAPSITGVDRDVYNWYISPKRNLLRHGAWIHSVFNGNDNYQIRFASALKNADVSSTYLGKTVVENSNINIGDLDKPFFYPFLANLTTDMPNDVWKFISDSIYGYSSFTFRGVTLNGYHTKLSVDLAANSQRDLQLLLMNPLQLLR